MNIFSLTISSNEIGGPTIRIDHSPIICCYRNKIKDMAKKLGAEIIDDFHIAVPSNETLCELITYCSLLDTNYFIITTNHGSNIFACIKKNPRMEDSREELLKIALSLNGEFDPNKTEINYNDPEGQFEPDKAEIINFNDPEKASKFIKKLLSYI